MEGRRNGDKVKEHTKSHILLDAEQKQLFERSLGQTYLLMLESLLERQEAAGSWSSPWGHRHWGQPFAGVCSTMWMLVLASTLLESSL